MTEWLIVVVVGLGTYAARVSFIGALGERRFPPAIERALDYVAPAVFAALVLPAVLLHDGSVDLAASSNPRFLAALVAGLAAWRIKHVAAVIMVGMAALWLLQALT